MQILDDLVEVELFRGSIDHPTEKLSGPGPLRHPHGDLAGSELNTAGDLRKRAIGGGVVQHPIPYGRDDPVATLGLVRGTHRSAFMGIPPTGRSFACQFLALDRIADGKVVEHNSEVGWLSVLRQLGVLPIIPLSADLPPRPASFSGPSSATTDIVDQ